MTISDSDSVFVNCPFTADYTDIFQAIVFAVMDCGFKPRCSFESQDGDRLARIQRIIRECRYGIHDISLATPDMKTGLARMNMPLELGLDLGAKKYGQGVLRSKRLLVFEGEKYSSKTYLSDLNGIDPVAHSRDAISVVKTVRNFLKTESRRNSIPGEKEVVARYMRFGSELPLLCAEVGNSHSDLQYVDFLEAVEVWEVENARSRQ